MLSSGAFDYDIVVVGAGPAGLCASVFARARSLRVAVLEAGQAGGQLVSLFPKKPLYNVPALASTLAGDYARSLIQQARAEGVEIHEGEPVQRLEASEMGVAAVSDQCSYRGRAIILATGMGKMEPRRLNVPGEAENAGGRLVYAVTDPQVFASQRVLVVGGGDSAVDNALLLSETADQVILAHRSSQLRAQATRLDMLPLDRVRVLTDVEVRCLRRQNDSLLAQVFHSPTGEEQTLEVDRVVVNVGLVPSPGPLTQWGLRLDGKLIAVDSQMKTNLPAVFACGDAVSYPGKLKMVVTAIGEAATAVNTAFEYIKSGGAL